MHPDNHIYAGGWGHSASKSPLAEGNASRQEDPIGLVPARTTHSGRSAPTDIVPMVQHTYHYSL